MIIKHRTATSQNNFKYINLRTHNPIYSYYWFAKFAIIIHFPNKRPLDLMYLYYFGFF